MKFTRYMLIAAFVCSCIVLVGCNKKDVADTLTDDMPTENEQMSDTVQNGDKISVWYVGSSEGEVFDTNIVDTAKEANIYNAQRPYQPLTFVVGAGQMIAGFDSGVVGMKIGESKTLSIPASEGYGEVRDDLMQTFPISVFEDAGADWESWEVGQTYNFDRLQGTVVSKDDENITIDFNHFLAGKDLTFEVTIDSIDTKAE